MTDNFRIKNWNEDDFDIVRSILKTTWLDTYSAFIPEKDILWYLETYYNPKRLQILLEDPFAAGVILYDKEKPCGWLRTEFEFEKNEFHIVSLYVLPEFQGIGAGKYLLDYATVQAKKGGFDKIWLGVMMDNKKAHNWYIKNGFIFQFNEPFLMGKTAVEHIVGFKEV